MTSGSLPCRYREHEYAFDEMHGYGYTLFRDTLTRQLFAQDVYPCLERGYALEEIPECQCDLVQASDTLPDEFWDFHRMGLSNQ